MKFAASAQLKSDRIALDWSLQLQLVQVLSFKLELKMGTIWDHFQLNCCRFQCEKFSRRLSSDLIQYLVWACVVSIVRSSWKLNDRLSWCARKSTQLAPNNAPFARPTNRNQLLSLQQKHQTSLNLIRLIMVIAIIIIIEFWVMFARRESCQW